MNLYFTAIYPRHDVWQGLSKCK